MNRALIGADDQRLDLRARRRYAAARLELAAGEKSRFFQTYPFEPGNDLFAYLRNLFRVGLQFEFSHPGLAQIAYRAVYGGGPHSGEATARLRHNSAAYFRDLIADYDGYEVKSQGDGFMLAFPEPCRALEYAISIQRAFAEREREAGEDALRVRMGLHTGEVIAEEGDFFGKNVILAARIAAKADGGEILVSEQMRAAAEDHGSEGPEGIELHFDEGRELELKGLEGTHRVYRSDWQPETAAAS